MPNEDLNEDLSPLIVEIDVLRMDLGIPRWSQLAPWCEGRDPLTCDRADLERLHLNLFLEHKDRPPVKEEIDALCQELGINRWSQLAPWCDAPELMLCDLGALERLLERLCMRWADG